VKKRETSAGFGARTAHVATLFRMVDPAELRNLVADMRWDNEGRSPWSAQFECISANVASVIVEVIRESVSHATARVGDDQPMVIVEFPVEFAVAIARFALSAGATYRGRGQSVAAE
jgi:hypothetical protein